MEDHHVDRPGVEAQQCVKLTGTNRSFGLIRPPRRMQGPQPPAGSHNLDPSTHVPEHRSQKTEVCQTDPDLCSDDLVVMARAKTPDPIPNSAVKTLSANGTAS